MKWTLIFCDSTAGSPQVFLVEGEDPAAEARALKADQDWLRDYALLAAVPGHHDAATRDDAHSFDECSLHMNGAAGVTEAWARLPAAAPLTDKRLDELWAEFSAAGYRGTLWEFVNVARFVEQAVMRALGVAILDGAKRDT